MTDAPACGLLQSSRRPGQAILGRQPAALLAATVLLLSAACTPVRTKGVVPQAWGAGPSEPLAPGEPAREQTVCFSRTDNTIRLSGAVNETVAFEFFLTATAGPNTGVEVAVGDLVGSETNIPRSAFRLYRHWPVVIERYPNWYLRSVGLRERREIPDVLVPIEARNYGQPFNIAPGGTLPLWVEIRIPQDARPGTYRSELTVRSAGGGTARTAIELLVRDVFLAREDAIPILAGVQLPPIIASHTQLDPANIKVALADSEAARVIRRAFVLLHEHGLSPYTDEVRPRFKQNIDGAVELDWSQYDAFCGSLIDGSAYDDRQPAAAWPLPVDLSQPDPLQYSGVQSAVYAAVLRDYLSAVETHFQDQGWLDRVFVDFHLREASNPRAEDLELVRQFAAITHLVDPRLAFLSTLIPQPMAPFGWFDHHYEDLTAEVDIWTTPARYQHQPTLEQQRALGKQTWLLPDRPPFSGSVALEALPIQARSLPWQAFLQGHDAVILPRATDWPSQLLDTPIRDAHQPSDTWLLYPGRPFGLDEPVPSVRLKQLQLGLQDYQYLRLLDRHGRAETARLLAGSLIKATGTEAYGDNYRDGLFGRRVEDVSVWEMARSILESEAADALSARPGETLDLTASNAAWAKFLAATRSIEVWPESARLTRDTRGAAAAGEAASAAGPATPARRPSLPADERSAAPGYLVTFDVAVRSELRTPLQGKLSFGPMPAGMHSVSDIVRVGPLPEMGLARKQLIAGMPSLPPCDLDGHYTQEIVFDAGPSGRASANATVSVVTVPDAATPITVDGDLADWPPNAFNAAGDFRLINGRRDGAKEGDRAHSQTIVFLCRQNAVLLIGIRAATPESQDDDGEAIRFSNVVQYEDLMPTGADLVEILIDPTNAGTQSGDLYHIVLKSTGDPVFERGIGVVPPIGRCDPWPGRPPDYCVTLNDQGWAAELAIPLSTFGPEAARSTIWGFNIARLEPRRGEYSDWARAPRYCYDPRTLGNMVWPK
jgi:hypothetical protein